MSAREAGPAGAAAYGLRIHGIRDSGLGLAHVPRSWPVVDVLQTREPHRPVDYEVDGGHVTVPLVTGGRLELERDAMTARFRVPELVPDDDLLHPYFAPAAGWFSHWLGRHCFHAGAVVLGRKAWAILGDKEAGKSSLVAWLASSGVSVVADDLVVVDGGNVLTGPRSIDLRAPTVAALPSAKNAAVVRGATRHRLVLPQTAHEWPLGGWIFVDWGEDVGMATIPPRARLARLSDYRVFRLAPADPATLLGLAALPTWELSRPKRWDVMDEVVEVLTRAVL